MPDDSRDSDRSPGSVVAWRLVDSGLHVRPFDDEIVVYNDVSGDTHLIGHVQWEVLAMLEQGPARAPEIAGSVFRNLRIPPEDRDPRQIHTVLATLSSCHLIEPVPE